MTTIEELKAYRDHPALSQSYLKDISNETYRKDKPSIPRLLGSYLDCLLLCPHLKDDLFLVRDFVFPSEAIQNILSGFTGSMEFNKDEIIAKARLLDYNRTHKDETLWNTFLKHEDFYEISQLNDKELINEKLAEEMGFLEKRSRNSQLIGKYFEGGHYQVPLYWDHITDCKGLIDIIWTDKDTIELIDFKYTEASGINNWKKVCWNKKYPFQLSFYKQGLSKHTEKKIKCKWIVVSKYEEWIVECPDQLLDMYRWGFEKRHDYFEGHAGRIDQSTHEWGWQELIEICVESEKLGIDPHQYEKVSTGGIITL
jgi:hypothetical protein